MRNPFRLKNAIEDEERAINHRGDKLDFEESLADLDSQGRLERPGEDRLHFLIIWLVLLLAFGGVFGRLYYLAVAKHGYFQEIAEGNRLRIEYLPAPRGVIYDASGKVLASNLPSFELVASPMDLPKDEPKRSALINKAAEILGLPFEEISKSLESEQVQAFESILIKQNLTREQALIFQEQAANLPGLRVAQTPIREYPDAPVYSHLLGYVGKLNLEEYEAKAKQGYLYNDTLGRTGLEQFYEKYLRGTFGQRQVEVDARGAVQKVYGQKDPRSGDNLYLNIDSGLEEKLYQSLARTLSGLHRHRAAAIAMNPQNGKILALLSFPSFDNNLFAQGISSQGYQNLETNPDKPLFNRAIAGVYPPGSTVKPMVAGAALQEKVVTPRTLIEDKGYIVIKNPYGGPDSYFYGYSRKPLGIMDVKRAIALSSDIYFYVVGGGYDQAKIQGLGIEKLAEYYRQFQIDEELGIDLPGAQAGLVPTPEWKKQKFENDPVLSRWYLGNTYHVSIGQGDLLATPLHVLSWISTIANGGKIFRPYIVSRIVSEDGKEVQNIKPEVTAELKIAPEYLEIIREGMRQAVTEGTAKSLNSLPVEAAGKTGTAQFDSRDLGRAHAWFAAFAPYENPEIAIVVMIEDGGEGSVNAAPVVREALDWWAKNRYNKN
jgi:penicillin-binding protein 2